MFRQLRTSAIMLTMLTLVTGVAYPLAVTAFAQLTFSHAANGSLIPGKNGLAGSELIGQPFTKAEYFWGRLSATSPFAYNAAASSGSNLGPLNPALRDAAQARIDALKQRDPQIKGNIPIDLVTASGSGLDPHISAAAAEIQIRGVAIARKIPEEKIRELVRKHTEKRQWSFFGEPRVNVLGLNLTLDNL